ncbi:DUF5615 family PIN-like protein [Microlunatus sp. GCM10028923]|uniref:DUF5615 family PIN-like protein n=1 Tax=Microlunatus sp. GCM10028923 TaxID=3273400 RepID=UPI00360BC035
MKFLIDENLSPRLCAHLSGPLDSAAHLHDSLTPGTSDREILDHAAELDLADIRIRPLPLA